MKDSIGSYIMTKQAILENKKMNDAMKNFKVIPYAVVSESLNEATKKTIEFAKKKANKNG
jgi:hypothetical protein